MPTILFRSLLCSSLLPLTLPSRNSFSSVLSSVDWFASRIRNRWVEVSLERGWERSRDWEQTERERNSERLTETVTKRQRQRESGPSHMTILQLLTTLLLWDLLYPDLLPMLSRYAYNIFIISMLVMTYICIIYIYNYLVQYLIYNIYNLHSMVYIYIYI